MVSLTAQAQKTPAYSPLHAAMLAVIEAAKAHSCQMGEAALDETLAALERAL
jgi:hypothetical protein